MKKLTLILAAAAILAAVTYFINWMLAAILAAVIIFISILPTLIFLIIRWQEKYEMACWKQAIEEKKKVKERIAKTCREVPQEHFA